jgi:hypothetical protein
MKSFRIRRPSPAMVVAIAALVLAMGGVGYAATSLPKNSVGTKQIKKSAVTTAKVKNHTLTGKDIKLSKLGTVPTATLAVTAESANALGPLTVHAVGAAGEPPFLSGTVNYPSETPGLNFPPVTFRKDHDGFVHLDGIAAIGKTGTIPGILFQLPAGFRPPAGTTEYFTSDTANKEKASNVILIFGSGVSLSGTNVEGYVLVTGENPAAVLDGIVYPAGS